MTDGNGNLLRTRVTQSIDSSSTRGHHDHHELAPNRSLTLNLVPFPARSRDLLTARLRHPRPHAFDPAQEPPLKPTQTCRFRRWRNLPPYTWFLGEPRAMPTNVLPNFATPTGSSTQPQHSRARGVHGRLRACSRRGEVPLRSTSFRSSPNLRSDVCDEALHIDDHDLQHVANRSSVQSIVQHCTKRLCSVQVRDRLHHRCKRFTLEQAAARSVGTRAAAVHRCEDSWGPIRVPLVERIHLTRSPWCSTSSPTGHSSCSGPRRATSAAGTAPVEVRGQRRARAALLLPTHFPGRWSAGCR